MMETVFLHVLNRSIAAGWLILAVLVLRLPLKRAPKTFTVAMWALVGVRLACPFSLESTLSLVPSAETVPTALLSSAASGINSGIPVIDATVGQLVSGPLAPEPGASIDPVQVIVFAAAAVWILGMAVMVCYTVISCARIRRRVREAVPMPGKEGVWSCDRIDTAFILGLVRPRIYLPSGMREQDIPYVIAHEGAHLKRRDHWWRPLGFLLLTVYWLSPLLWVAYILFCRDIELACDEKAIKELGPGSKKPYADALIDLSTPRRAVAACPLAFGEGTVKGRVKAVLNDKKPTVLAIAAAVIACVALAIGLLTDPPAEPAAAPTSPVELLPSDGGMPSATFDIDGDGIDEQCTLGAGPTSGLFTFTLSVTENGTLEYLNTFRSSPSLALSFLKDAEGKTILVGKDGEDIHYLGWISSRAASSSPVTTRSFLHGDEKL